MPRTRTLERKVVERFHHRAIVLLRRLREIDAAHGFSGARASALSVLVFRGEQTLSQLAAAEGVKPPTMSRLVKAMRSQGLVEIESSAHDQRQIRIAASARGRALLLEGRRLRLKALAGMFAGANRREREALAVVVELLGRALGTKTATREQ